jgi:hypothetical protein
MIAQRILGNKILNKLKNINIFSLGIISKMLLFLTELKNFYKNLN